MPNALCLLSDSVNTHNVELVTYYLCDFLIILFFFSVKLEESELNQQKMDYIKAPRIPEKF